MKEVRAQEIWRASRWVLAWIWPILLVGGCGLPAPAPPGGEPPLEPSAFTFVARTEIPSGEKEVPVGGLSGMFYEAESGRFRVVSDDKGDFGPPRIYRIRIDLHLEQKPVLDAAVEGWTPLGGWEGRVLGMDPEGVAPTPAEGGFFLSSEGWVEKGLEPFVARFDSRGVWEAGLPLPSHFRIGSASGPRHNRAFESLTLAPSGRYLFTGTESALLQDGPPADPARGSPSRILRWDVQNRRWDRELVYLTEPIHAPSAAPGGFETAGLVELLALDEDSLLALERSYATGSGFAVRLFAVEIEGATDVSGVEALRGAPETRPVRKRLVLDLGDLGFPLDNIEAMAFGPRLPDGRKSLYLVSDDNFNPGSQVTQVLAFAVDDRG